MTTISFEIYTIFNEIVFTTMQIQELSLYPTIQPTKTTHNIAQILPENISSNPQASIETVLNSMFPQQAEESKIAKTRKILNATAKTLSDEQIECINSEFQFLIDSWLDEYEKDVFNGMTLKEVLNGK